MVIKMTNDAQEGMDSVRGMMAVALFARSSLVPRRLPFWVCMRA